jgi:hypothetical protein
MPRRAAWGRRLFVLTLLGLGVGVLIAARSRADALTPLGLAAGLLVVGMVCEVPPLRHAEERYAAEKNVGDSS